MTLTTVIAHAEPASNPGFDCRKAITPVEKLICSEPSLADLDRQMAEVFKQMLANTQIASRKVIIERQLRWLQDRATGCGLDSRPHQPNVRTLDAAPAAICLAHMYEGWLKNAPYIIARAWGSQRTEFPFEAKRQPFTPRLLESHDAKLCDAFLSALKEDFLARHHGDGEYVFKKPPMSLGRWLDWPSDHHSLEFGDRASIDLAELDLDQNGQKQLLLHVTRPFGSRGNTYFLFTRPKTATDGLSDDVKDFADHLPNDRKSTSIRGVEPYADSGIIYGYSSPVKILAYQGGMYLYLAKYVNFFSATDTRDGTAVLRRIHADGSTELRCEVSVSPKAGTLPQPRPVEPPDSLPVPAEAVKWLQTIREIQSNESGFSGTLHALNRLIVSSETAGYNALVRPWEVAASRLPYQPAAAPMRSWIHEWGYGSLSRYRLVRTAETDYRAALAALADYYVHSFGVPNGKKAAEEITDNLISASFVVSGLGGADQEYKAPPEDLNSRMRVALLSGSSPDMINRLIDSGALLTGIKGWGPEGVEPALFCALEYPDEVRLLLDKGVDVNEGNSFGKTALMYVAHYDLADTMVLLLAKGADVAKRTNGQTVPGVNLSFDSRTALMYAAENASERTIDLLLQAGADVCAADSGKRDVRNYLSRNQRLPDAARTRFTELIAAKSCDTADQGAPK